MNSCFSSLFVVLAITTINLFDLTPSTALKFQDQIIQVRGFWYPLNEQQGVLSPYPHLKSCCIGNINRVEQQIFVQGEIKQNIPQQLIVLKGIFKISPKFNQEGQLIQFYILENPHLIQPLKSSIGLIMILILIFLFIFYKLTKN